MRGGASAWGSRRFLQGCHAWGVEPRGRGYCLSCKAKQFQPHPCRLRTLASISLSACQMGDLHRYKLLLSEPETRRARDLIARADAAAAAAAASASSSAGGTWRSGCGGNGNGGGAMGLLGSMLHGISAGRGGSAAASGGAAAAAGPRRGPVTDAAQQLSELLSSKIARYYT